MNANRSTFHHKMVWRSLIWSRCTPLPISICINIYVFVYNWPYRCVSSSSEIGMCQCAGEIVFDDIVDTYVCIVSILYVIHYWILLACMWMRKFLYFFSSFVFFANFVFLLSQFLHTHTKYIRTKCLPSLVLNTLQTKCYKIYVYINMQANRMSRTRCRYEHKWNRSRTKWK